MVDSELDHPLHGQPAAGDALAVHERQQRLDAGRAVADPVEGDAGASLGLLDADAIGDMVGRHEIERTVGQAHPQRVAIGRRAQRR